MKKTVTKRVYKAVDRQDHVLFEANSAKDLGDMLGLSISTIEKFSRNPGVYCESTYIKNLGIPEFRVEYSKWREEITLTDSPAVVNKVMDLPEEQWKSLPGYAGILVSNLGRVKRLKDNHEELCRITTSRNGTGKIYHQVYFKINGKTQSFRLSRVICRAWLDETLDLSYKLDKRVPDHIDNNSENDIVSNLRIVTQSENIAGFWREQNDNKAKPGINRKTCYIRDITDNSIREFYSVVDAGKFAFGKDIKVPDVRFAQAVREKSLVRKRYMLGYDKDELVNRNPDDHCRRVFDGEVGSYFKNNSQYIYTCNETNVSGTPSELSRLYGIDHGFIILAASESNCRKSCKGKDGMIYTFSRKLK